MTAIILHLYYIDLWNEFKEKLLQLPSNEYELYITLCETNPDITDLIKSTFPASYVIKTKNKGYDIGPFIKTFQYIIDNNKKYDTIIKIHGKKSVHHPVLGITWRTNLVNALIGNKEQFINNNSIILSTDNKMLTCSNYIYTADDYNILKDHFDNIISTFNLSKEYINKHQWCAGTMFVSDFNVLYNFLSALDLNKLYNMLPDGASGHGLPHALERILGYIVNISGYKISSTFKRI
jgi:lipopolysaccharide biosynthesis protein